MANLYATVFAHVRAAADLRIGRDDSMLPRRTLVRDWVLDSHGVSFSPSKLDMAVAIENAQAYTSRTIDESSAENIQPLSALACHDEFDELVLRNR